MKKVPFLILVFILGIIILGSNIYQNSEKEKINIEKEKAHKAAFRRSKNQLATITAITKAYPLLTNEDAIFLIKFNNSLNSIDTLFSHFDRYPIVINSVKENQVLLWADGKREKHFKDITPYENIFFFTGHGEKQSYLYPLVSRHIGYYKYDPEIQKNSTLDSEFQNVGFFAEYILDQYKKYIEIRKKIIPNLYTKEHNTISEMEKDLLKKIDCNAFKEKTECSNFQSIITNIEKHSFSLPKAMSYNIAAEIQKNKSYAEILAEELTDAFAYTVTKRNPAMRIMARNERAQERKRRAQFLFDQPAAINELNILIEIYPDFQK